MLRVREVLQNRGKKGSPAEFVQFIQRLQRNRELGIVDKKFELLEGYEFSYSKGENKIFFTDMYSNRVSKSATSLNQIFYRKRLPEELNVD
ncbi:MAG: hypothetical protein ACR2PX_19550 [Endozoicomonas sp.]|uniref:hypothetical protein n=1 Tax=Endozoicomonas sp. TaxID=1892382 RepID=UPI003D9B1B28